MLPHDRVGDGDGATWARFEHPVCLMFMTLTQISDFTQQQWEHPGCIHSHCIPPNSNIYTLCIYNEYHIISIKYAHFMTAKQN